MPRILFHSTKVFPPFAPPIARLVTYLGSATFLFYTATAIHPLAPFLAPPACLGAAALVAFPFVGIFTMTLFSQMDAILDKLMLGLPGMKVLATLTFSGVALQLLRQRLTARGIARQTPTGTNAAIPLIFAFFLWTIISAFFAGDKVAAVDSIQRLAPLVLLFFSIVTLVDTHKKLVLLSVAVLISTAISSLVIISDSVTGHFLLDTTASEWQGYARSAGATTYDPTTSAALLLTGVAMAAYIATLSKGTIRWLGAVTVLLGTLGIIFSFARSAALGLLLVAAFTAFRFRHSKVTIFLLLISPLLIPAFSLIAPDSYTDRLLTLFGVGEHDITLDRRMSYHWIGIDLFLRHPLFGIGLGNFPDYYVNFDYRWIEGRTLTPRVLHNMYLAVCVETGFPGGLLFSGIITASLIPAFRCMNTATDQNRRSILEATLAATVILLLIAVTLPMLYNKYIWTLLALTVAAGRVNTATSVST